MPRLPPESVALRRTCAGTALGFLTGFVATLSFAVPHFVIDNWNAYRWPSAIGGAIESLFLASFAGCLTAIPANWLLERWYHLRGFYACVHCHRPVRHPRAFCPCQHDDPWVRRALAARARKPRQRWRHVRPRRVAAVLAAYAVLTVPTCWFHLTAPGLKRDPLFPYVLVTHMLLCWLVLIGGALTLQALEALRYTRRRLRARLQAFLHLFAVWPLTIAVGWLVREAFR